HVTLEAGTGCVHTAPGHGSEDLEICKKYDTEFGTNIGVVVPVDDKGYMTKEAGKYEGLRYYKANSAILEDMKTSGALLAQETITHSYPHCWRCKNPVIYRATEQWFASVSAMKDAAVKSCDDIWWIPKWGKERMVAMIVERSDWCISRQRHWGVPIPIFYCKDCGEYLINDDTINAVSDVFKVKGSNAWYEMEADEILPDNIKCPKCGCKHFTKETDIMDVWFDSGSTHASVLDAREELRSPADIYLEGGDQYRGWFQSSMLTSIASKGVAPYKIIITHGWTVDGEGKAMHKSAGNTIAPEEIIGEYGADILRLWVSSVDYTNDVKISKEILKQLSEVYRKIRNTSRIILANLNDFNPDTDMVAFDDLYEIDKWALSRLNKLIKNTREAYDNYDFTSIYHSINNFCTIDMSKLYIDITKDRVYVEKSDSLARRSAQTAMYIIIDSLTRILAPLLAFTSEEIWSFIPHKLTDNTQSILLNDMPDYNSNLGFDELETKWNAMFDWRDNVLKALETARDNKLIGKSLEAKVVIKTSNDELFNLLNGFELATIFIVSQVEVIKSETDEIEILPADGEKCDRCWTHSTDGSKTEDGFICSRCKSIIGA
ncbi:MAG: class I tRNA ligase family protein, partial [Oscillospiraceae bacterium]|nr:class I tRNA ligase family protein [Oscillospiraceae bacterium]